MQFDSHDFFDRDQLCRALARTTRFNPLDEDLSRPPSGPIARWILVAIRGIMGFIYAFCGWFLLHLGIAPLLAAILATVAILALHSYLTAGMENRLSLKWFTSVCPPDSNGSADRVCWQLQAMGALLAPVILMILQFHLNASASWLIMAMSIGAAGGVEYAAGTEPGKAPRSLAAWLLAFFLSLISMTVASGLSGRVFFNSLLISVIVFLLIPWVRKIPNAPRGLAAGTFAAEMIVLVLTLLLSSVN